MFIIERDCRGSDQNYLSMMITKQELLHALALQKHTSIYLGNSSPIKKQKQKERMVNEADNILEESQRKELKRVGIINPESAFKSVSASHPSQSREDMIKYIQSHPLHLQSPKKYKQPHPFERLQAQLSFQSYSQQMNKEQEQQKKLIAQYFRVKKQKLQAPKMVKQTSSVLVPSYLQSLIQDIHRLTFQKKTLKMEYYRTKQIGTLSEIIELNNTKMKPLLNLYIGKIMGITITEQTQTDELEVIMMLSMGEKMFEGRPKKELMDLLVKCLKDVSSEEREYKLVMSKDGKKEERDDTKGKESEIIDR